MEAPRFLEGRVDLMGVPLKDLKESFPVQVAEYAVVNKIVEEPACF
jgi:hypothetical protein